MQRDKFAFRAKGEGFGVVLRTEEPSPLLANELPVLVEQGLLASIGTVF
jgi:hypothetical protein